MLWLLKKRIFYGHDMKLPFQMQSFEWVKNLRLYKFCGPITQHLYTNTQQGYHFRTLFVGVKHAVHYGLKTMVEKYSTMSCKSIFLERIIWWEKFKRVKSRAKIELYLLHYQKTSFSLCLKINIEKKFWTVEKNVSK